MIWRVDLSRDAEKFVQANRIEKEEALALIGKAIQRFQGESINIDLKKLKGAWQGFYRIRMGKMRIIAEFDFENSAVFIEQIDWRGNVYK